MSTDLVPVANMDELATLDAPSREVAVTNMLTEARQWLAHAVESSEPARIAEFRAFVATIAETTKQLNLSKEIQQDAQEMVRRAERGVGVAIRKGQEVGEIATVGSIGAVGHLKGGDGSGTVRGMDLVRPSEIVPNSAVLTGYYHLADGADDELFETVVTEAKAEGDLSRRNLVRKIRTANPPARPETRGRPGRSRKPLPEEATHAGFELRKSIDRIKRVIEDDRLRSNEEQVTLALTGHLTYAAETVAAVLTRLTN